jgi:CheY-like chemotaxis protein
MAEPNSGVTPLPSNRYRVLLVEDNPEGRTSLARLLELYGFEVTAVGDGASALRELTAGAPPDVLLTDLMLPDIDGHEIARRAAQLRPRPLITMATGYNLADLRLHGRSPQADHFFLKPLEIDRVVEVLLRELEKRGNG